MDLRKLSRQEAKEAKEQRKEKILQLFKEGLGVVAVCHAAGTSRKQLRREREQDRMWSWRVEKAISKAGQQ